MASGSKVNNDPFLFPEETSSEMSNDDPAILVGSDVLSPEPTETPTATGIEPGPSGNVAPYFHTPFGLENPNDYFSSRTEVVQEAIQECVSTLVFPSEDGPLMSAWLLTEISSWDNERERIVILTKLAVMVIKYDFISRKKLEFKRIPLNEVDTIVIGDLVYPKSSLVPRINGITNGLTSVVRDRFSQPNTSEAMHQAKKDSVRPTENNKKKFGFVDLNNFEPRDRNMNGIRILWNRGQPVPFLKKWNPFEGDIPFSTFTFHPLYYHKGNESSKELFDVAVFSRKVVDTVEELQINDQACKVHHAPIILQSYVGIVPLFHNKSSLGFFKNRGKFSF